MALPKLLKKLFENNGFGDKLSLNIIPNLDANKITSGKLNPARLPDLVINKVEYVENVEAQIKLTNEIVQNGDIVVVNNDLVYLVKDDSNLDDINSGYLLLCSAQNISANGGIQYSETTGKLKTPITFKINGCNSDEYLLDGSSNIEINIESINTELCSLYNKVITCLESFNLEESMLNTILNCTGNDIKITLSNIATNGWNCTVLNNSSSVITITGCEINKHTTLLLSPGNFVKLIANNKVFIALDSTPKIIL
jgi:hypothetical protein